MCVIATIAGLFMKLRKAFEISAKSEAKAKDSVSLNEIHKYIAEWRSDPFRDIPRLESLGKSCDSKDKENKKE